MTKESVKPKPNETYDEYIERLVGASLAGKKYLRKKRKKFLGLTLRTFKKK